MCFSATASFSVGAAIAATGIVAVAQEKPPSQRMLALVPLMFAAQQIAEGFVWLTIDPNGRAQNLVAVSVFLAFALVIWPLWVPLSLLIAEKNPGRRRLLTVFCGAGFGLAVYTTQMLLGGRPGAHLAGHRLAYDYTRAGPALASSLSLPAYAIPSVLPFFVSTISRAKTIGVVLAAALVATYLLERRAFASVWCFFAAIISAIIVISIRQDQRLSLNLA